MKMDGLRGAAHKEVPSSFSIRWFVKPINYQLSTIIIGICMCIYIYVLCMCIYIYIHTYTYIHAYVHTHIHTHTHKYIHTCTYKHIHTRTGTSHVYINPIAICILVYPNLIKTLQQLAYRREETECRPANCIHDIYSVALVGNQ